MTLRGFLDLDIKTRVVPGVRLTTYSDGVLVGSGLYGGGYETIHTISHDLRDLGVHDIGGPFRLKRDTTISGAVPVVKDGAKGSTFAVMPKPIVGVPPERTDEAILGDGTTAIARSTPTNPIFNGTTAVAEAVSGGLPAIAGVRTWKEKTAAHRKRYRRGLSDEYLNYQFGWVPFVSDMRNFAYAVKNSSEILKDFKAGSGKNTRVGYHFPESVYNASEYGDVLTVRHNSTVGEAGKGLTAYSSGLKTWFNGCFTYYIPMGQSTEQQIDRYAAYANKLLGVRITPETLWNLAPWSWALDWFGNIGDIMHNISVLGNDGLVMKYGYIMSHRWGRTVTTWKGDPYGRTSPGGSVTRTVESMFRYPASPYFGFAEFGSLTATQTAVITALGLKRV